MTREQSYSIALENQKNKLAIKKAAFENAIERLMQNNSLFAETTRNLSYLGAQLAITALSGDTTALAKMQGEMSILSEARAKILADNGIVDIVYDCELCKDSGYIKGKICDCIHKSAQAIMIENLSKSLPLKECNFENFDLNYYPTKAADGTSPKKHMTAIFKMCREYVINFNPNSSESLLFMGNTGLGKTHLTLSIVSELLKRGFNVIYGAAYNLFGDMESEHFDRHTNVSYTAAIECDLLVIDDLGGEFVSPYIQSLFYNIVNTRELGGKPTIINTNLTMSEIASRYTPRVASRLFNYNTEQFIGEDIRLQKAIEKN